MVITFMVIDLFIFIYIFFFLSAKTRQGALDGLKTAMATRILYEFISERRMTITDSIERCLKKGTKNVLLSMRWQVFQCFKLSACLSSCS